MLPELNAGFTSLQALVKFAQGMQAMSTQVQVNDAKITLQGHVIAIQGALLAAQTEQAASSERVRDLEEQIVKLENWEGQKQRYELRAIDPGAVAYVAKAGMENGEAPHWLCAACFEKREKSYLTSKGEIVALGGGMGMKSKWGCSFCSAVIFVGRTASPTQPTSAPEPPPQAMKVDYDPLGPDAH